MRPFLDRVVINAYIGYCRLAGLIAFALIVLVGRNCFPDGRREDLVFTFIYSQIATQVLVLISEALVAIVSSRGTIIDFEPRRSLPYFLSIRAVLYVVEILGIVLGGYVAWSPYIQDHIYCERSDRVSQAIEGYVISVIVLQVIIAVLFMIYFDPLQGCRHQACLKSCTEALVMTKKPVMAMRLMATTIRIVLTRSRWLLLMMWRLKQILWDTMISLLRLLMIMWLKQIAT